MFQQIRVDAVGKESREVLGGPRRGQWYWPIKSGDRWLNYMHQTQPQRGDVLNVDITEERYQKKTGGEGLNYYATPAQEQAQPKPPQTPPMFVNGRFTGGEQPKPPASNGWPAPETQPQPRQEAQPQPQPQPIRPDKITAAQWASAMSYFHSVAKQLEPDDYEITPMLDRAESRTAITNTCLIALSNGKIDISALPPDVGWEDVPREPGSDDDDPLR